MDITLKGSAQQKPNKKKPAKEKKSLISIPAEYRKLIFQPNCITNAQYSYTLIQERIFNYIIFYLQTYIKKIMDGEVVKQLKLFTKKGDEEYIDLILPMQAIAKPYQYPDVRGRAIDMTQILVQIKTKDKFGQNIERVQGLLTHVDLTNEECRRTAYLPIRISELVARLLIDIDRKDGTPINYTSFLFDVALGAENKYTPRIYKYLSSWKEKAKKIPNFRKKVTYEEFREWLQIGKKYPEFEQFKRCILWPVQEELREKADFWFDFQEIRDGKKVIEIEFFHKFPKDDIDPALTECKLWNTFVIKLRGNPWYVDDMGINIIASKLRGRVNMVEVNNTLKQVLEWYYSPEVQNNPNKRAHNPSHAIVKILLRDFA